MRVIASLLVKNRLAYVSDSFRRLHYVGDPLVTARILSSSLIDELMIIDLSASQNNKIDSYLISSLRSICDYPLSYSGGIRSTSSIDNLFSLE